VWGKKEFLGEACQSKGVQKQAKSKNLKTKRKDNPHLWLKKGSWVDEERLH